MECIEHIREQRWLIRTQALILKIKVKHPVKLDTLILKPPHLLVQAIRLSTTTGSHNHMYDVVVLWLLWVSQIKVSLKDLRNSLLLKVLYFLGHQVVECHDSPILLFY